MKFIGKRSNLIQLFALNILVLCFGQVAKAEEGKTQPALENRVTIYQSSAKGLIDDLEYMIKSLAKKGKVWRDYIEPNLEIFLDGVDSKKPVRVDVYFDEKQGTYYRFCFPYSNFTSFNNNVEASGITSEKKTANLYQLSSAFDGWMGKTPGYAIFVPASKKAMVTGVIINPLIDLKPLVANKYDTAVLINHDKRGLEQRKSSFVETRKNLLAGIKKKSTESSAKFELRKLIADNQLAELEQYYVEIKHLEAGWITDSKKNLGTGSLTLAAIEGTELNGALKQIATTKSRFVDVPETKDFTLSGRLLFPIVKTKQIRYKALYQAAIPVIHEKIEKEKEYSASQKKAAKSAVEKVIAILIHELELGVIDGFVEMRRVKQDDPNSFHELIAGVKARNGQTAKDVIKLLPEISSDIKVKMDLQTVGKLSLHEISISGKILPMIDSLFGTPAKIFIATGDQQLFIAIGANSKPWLIETLGQISKSKEKIVPEFVKIKGHIKPFALALSARDPMTELKEAAKATREKLIEAFDEKKYKTAEDYFEIVDKLENDEVKGTMKVEPGLFRFIGLLVAEFAKNNL